MLLVLVAGEREIAERRRQIVNLCSGDCGKIRVPAVFDVSLNLTNFNTNIKNPFIYFKQMQI